MATKQDAFWNEVARIVSIEFLQYGQPVTGPFLIEIIKYVNELLTEKDPSA